MDGSPCVQLRDITKTFPGGVVANDGVDFSVTEGEIHGLLGENGAGKSTLMNILYGLFPPDSGEIRVRGEPVTFDDPSDAIRHGIGMVHQEFMLIERLTVAENVALLEDGLPAGHSPEHSQSLLQLFSTGLRDGTWQWTAERITELDRTFGFNIDPAQRVWELSVGKKQRVEILKALYQDIDILILDEPTAVLSPHQKESLFETLQRMAENGVAIIFITHKIDEITQIADRVTVLRAGKSIDTVTIGAVSKAELARKMVGHDVSFTVDKPTTEPGERIVSVDDVSVVDDQGVRVLEDISFELFEHEIVGVAGVSGNGQTHLGESLIGLREPETGLIRVGDRDLVGSPPREFKESGISYIPPDRYHDGCAPDLNITHNATIKNYPQMTTSLGLLQFDRMTEYAKEIVSEFDVRAKSVEQSAGNLSGGNLQKLIVGRELHRDPSVILANQPTRGLDVGAKEYVHELLLDRSEAGAAVILISEELDEILNLSDRIFVMYEGEFVFETNRASTTKEEIGRYMTEGRNN